MTAATPAWARGRPVVLRWAVRASAVNVHLGHCAGRIQQIAAFGQMPLSGALANSVLQPAHFIIELPRRRSRRLTLEQVWSALTAARPRAIRAARRARQAVEQGSAAQETIAALIAASSSAAASASMAPGATSTGSAASRSGSGASAPAGSAAAVHHRGLDRQIAGVGGFVGDVDARPWRTITSTTRRSMPSG